MSLNQATRVQGTLPAAAAAHRYRPDIDGLRAVSIVLVVLFHAFPSLLRGGFIGVDVFFVISGFLISTIILEATQAGRFSFADFYARRVRRIFPALGLVLLATWLAGYMALTPSQFVVTGRETLAGALFYLNFQLVKDAGYFDALAATKPLLHLWSLGVEEQFYIVWPLLIYAGSRFKQNIFNGILVVIVASFIANLGYVYAKPQAAFYVPYTRLWELAMGGALAFLQLSQGANARQWLWAETGLRVGLAKIARARELASLAGLLLILSAAVVIDATHVYPGVWAMLPVLGALLVIASGAGARINRAVLGNRLMVGLGLISYPLYLWHWPVLFYVRLWAGQNDATLASLIGIGASLVLAVLTYFLCEQPLRRLYRVMPQLLTGSLCAAIGALALLGQVTIKTRGFDARFPQVAQLNAFVNQQIDANWRPNVCFFLGMKHGDEPTAWDQNNCTFHGPKTRPRLLIVGDSFAASLYPGLARQLGNTYDIGQLTAGFCIPMVRDLVVSGNKTATSRCRKIDNYIYEQIAQTQPDIVLIQAVYDTYAHTQNWNYPDFIETFHTDVTQLANSVTSKIIVLGQAPMWSPTLPVIVEDYLMARQLPPQRTKTGLLAQPRLTAQTMKDESWPANVTYVSLMDHLCNADGCLALTGANFPNDLITRDYGHFTESGSLYLAREVIVPAIAAAHTQH